MGASRIRAAWQLLRPRDAFCGLTLEHFNSVTQESIDTDARVQSLQRELRVAIIARDRAHDRSMRLIERLRAAIGGEPGEGSDSEFLDAVGFVRDSVWRARLRRSRRLRERRARSTS